MLRLPWIPTIIGAVDWSFHNSLCTLSKKLGSPAEAFRASEEKIPRKFKEVFFPSIFYDEEIGKKGEKKDRESGWDKFSVSLHNFLF